MPDISKVLRPMEALEIIRRIVLDLSGNLARCSGGPHVHCVVPAGIKVQLAGVRSNQVATFTVISDLTGDCAVAVIERSTIDMQIARREVLFAQCTLRSRW